MADFKVWDIVKVPFPYTDRPIREYRPALVIAAGDLAARHGLLWVVMITSSENRRWPEDVTIADRRATGLPAPSMVRCAKVATIEATQAQAIGVLPVAERGAVAKYLLRILAVAKAR